MYTAQVTTKINGDGKTIALFNGLIERVFHATADGGLCTVELRHLVSAQTFFRALSPEANVTLNGSRFDVGGCLGQDSQHYEFFNRDTILPALKADPKSFRLLNITQSTPAPLFDWEPGRRHAPRDIAWPPKGVKLSFFYSSPLMPAVRFEPAGRWQPKNGGGSGTAPAPTWQQFEVQPIAVATRFYYLEMTHTFSPYQPIVNEVRFKLAGGPWLNNSAAFGRATVVSASGSSGGAQSWWAMDGNTTTAWDSAMAPSPPSSNPAGYWIELHFDRPMRFEAIQIMSAGDGVHDPADLLLLGGIPGPNLNVTVGVHYELYDGLPALRKTVSVHNPKLAMSSVTVDHMTMELLRAPNWAPERITVEEVAPNNPTPFDQRIRPDPTSSFGPNDQKWHSDPAHYDQCCDQELHVTYSLYTFLVLGYSFNQHYNHSMGPGALLRPGDDFESNSVRMVFHDSNEPERIGLGVRKTHRILAPHLLENPIDFMITDISSTAVWREAIDQASATGQEIIIVGFGAAGYCGLCPSQTGNATWVSWFTEQVSYAKSKGVETSAYTLM